MFGGLGVWRDDRFFALTYGEEIYFKVDQVNRPNFIAAQSVPFSYEAKTSKGTSERRIINGLWLVPDDVLEDSDMLITWAQAAYEAALRAAREKDGPKPPSRTLKTLGEKLRRRLKEINITTWDELEDNGVIQSYLHLKLKAPMSTNLSVLWSLYAALHQILESSITDDMKENLLEILRSHTGYDQVGDGGKT